MVISLFCIICDMFHSVMKDTERHASNDCTYLSKRSIFST